MKIELEEKDCPRFEDKSIFAFVAACLVIGVPTFIAGCTMDDSVFAQGEQGASPNRGITVNTEEEWDGYHFSACIGEYYNGIPEHVEGSVIELGVADTKGSVIFADIIAKKMTETLEVLAEELGEGVID